ncbi:MAG: response regulator, partial [Clostridiales bacterium]|nr:response regulator [Clostridiales bacterium]
TAELGSAAAGAGAGQGAEAELEAGRGAGSGGAASPRILVVDDEPVNIQVLNNLLTMHGYAAISAYSGASALEMINGGLTFDLILLDVMMPKMSGYEVCRQLRTKNSLFDLPIVMLTAKNQIQDVVLGFQSGANDYIQKPFDKEELLARVRTLLELRNASAAAMAAARAKSQFIANMSHEIRTPLNAIIGLANILRKTRMDERQRDYIDKLCRASSALLGIIDDVLNFSKASAGDISLEHEPFDVRQLFGDLEALFRELEAESGTSLRFELDPSLPATLVGDPARLRQVFMSLIGNAFKFTEKGSVTVRAAVMAPGGGAEASGGAGLGAGMAPGDGEKLGGRTRLGAEMAPGGGAGARDGTALSGGGAELAGGTALSGGGMGPGSVMELGSDARPDGGTAPGSGTDAGNGTDAGGGAVVLRFDVEDTGIGMSASQTESIFSAFSQADGSSTRKYGGIGIGLTLTRQILELMGGAISVSSVEGRGTVFSFTCPFGIGGAPGGKLPFGGGLVAGVGKTGGESAGGGRSGGAEWAGDGQTTGAQAADGAQATGAEAPGDESGGDESSDGEGNAVLRGLRVLLVEDNEINAIIVTELLSAVGVSVATAGNGKEALDALADATAAAAAGEDQSGNLSESLPESASVSLPEIGEGHSGGDATRASGLPFDLVLMDLQMPVMDGYEATRIIKSSAEYADIPIIALTAHAFPEDRERCLELGMQEHLTKPINVDMLYRTLRGVARAARGRPIAV